jgi:hypothetical protein
MAEPLPRCAMIFSSPAKAPPQMKRMFVVSTCRNSCWGCLRPPCGGHARHGAFHDLEERLLHALARHVAGYGRVVGLPRDLVDLVDIDDAALRALDVVFGRLQELEDDVLHILADVAGFGQRGRVRHREGHVEDAGERLREQRLAAARGPDQQDVRFRQFDVGGLGGMVQPLVVVVYRDREHALGMHLPDDVIVEHVADVARGRYAVGGLEPGGLRLLPDDVHAELDAFIADEDSRARDQLAHLVLALSAEGAVEGVLAVAGRVRHHLSSGPVSVLRRPMMPTDGLPGKPRTRRFRAQREIRGKGVTSPWPRPAPGWSRFRQSGPIPSLPRAT